MLHACDEQIHESFLDMFSFFPAVKKKEPNFDLLTYCVSFVLKMESVQFGPAILQWCFSDGTAVLA